jgi:DNA polymerase III gamma/tau subunit
MSLYKKYRPRSLDEVVGQAATVNQLKGFGTKVPHVLGFFGAPGTGKTTLARIMAKVVGASEMNIIERNIGQDNGIDTIREIQQQSQLRPLGGGTTVYILDEFHSATKQAYQGLLKLLEDTPSHVYFFVCTSQPEKIDKAIRTRITGFQLNNLSQPLMAEHLLRVLSMEGFVSCPEPVQQIAKAANGSMRTALVMLEQVIASEFDPSVIANLKSEEDDFDAKPDLRNLARALIFKEGTWESIYALVDAIKDDELESARWFILAYAKSCMAKKNTAPMAARCILQMNEPFFNSKKPGFLAVCYKLFSAPSV